MKRILITHSYFIHFDPKQENLGQPYPPLGTLYAAAVLREAGFEVIFHDVMFRHDAQHIEDELHKVKPDYFVIYDDGFNYLTKMCLTNMREAAFKMAEIAHQLKIPVFISSSDSTDHFEKYLNNGVDYVLLGEAEETLLELLSRLENKATVDQSLLGIAYRNEHNDIQKNARRNVIRELDSLPMPAWDLLNIEPYRKVWLAKNGYFMINMGTTRGCPYKCNWCAKPIYGQKYNSRSPENVVKEIAWLQKNFGIKNIWFSDDIFGLKPNWVHEFANLLEKENLKIFYKIQSRADLLLQENYVADLARSGCSSVWMGAESGSQKILDAMDKGILVEDIRNATILLKKHHIKPSFFIQFGYLGEQWKDIELTINLINEMLPEDIGISVSYPLPGTKFYDKVKSDLVSKSNWTDSDDLDLMFKNTYEPEFYKALHRYVHKNYRKFQAIDSLKNIFVKTIHETPPSFRKLMIFPYYWLSAWWFKLKLNKHMANGSSLNF
jgi:anaerobic magnesium-protoporphyrin IX monomethyl ester cyclase